MSGRGNKTERDSQEDTAKGGKGAEQVGPDSDRSLDIVEVCRTGEIDGSTWHG